MALKELSIYKPFTMFCSYKKIVKPERFIQRIPVQFIPFLTYFF